MRLLRVAAAGLALAAALHGTARMLGTLFVLGVRERPVEEMLRPFGLFMGTALAAIVAWFLIARWRARRLESICAVTAALIYALAGWGMFLRGAPEGVPFGRVQALSPGGFWEDTPSRPRVYYTINSRGFRGPEFRDEKDPGVFRVAVIGDSYVFGSGVGDEDTLPQKLEEALAAKAPGRRIEVINLGIPGDNISSHVDLYEIAGARLNPDFAVVCLTLPNDLSRWDGQDERVGPYRIGWFSFVSWLVGERPAIFLAGELFLARGTEEADLSHFRAELARLGRDRMAGGPPLILFPYAQDDRIRSALPAGVTLVVTPESRDEYFIPGDGHPTAQGNAAFAAQLATMLVAK